MRMPAARQTASSSSTSVKPGVRTTRARTPLAAQARAASTTASAGTAITASSTSPSTSASAPISSTRCSGRVKPPARRLRTTSAPGRSDAPITATEAGRRTCATAATPASRWRASKRCRASRDSDVGSSSCTSPSDRCADTGKPESWNTPSMRRFSDRTVAVNVSMPSAEAACARWASSTVAIPWPCQASATAKATSARSGVSRKIGGVRDDGALAQRDQRQPVERRRGAAGGRVEVHPGAEEAKPARPARTARRGRRAAAARPRSWTAARARSSRRGGRCRSRRRHARTTRS